MIWARPRIRRLAISVCLLLTGAVIAGLPVYVWPQAMQLRYGDAILILGGTEYGRYPFGFDLGLAGLGGRTVVVSNPNGSR